MQERALAFAVAVLVASAGAYAQSPSPAPPGQSDQPSAQKPAAASPQPPSRSKPGPVAQTLVGKDAFSSDGTRVGDVRAVKTAPDGRITALLVRTGGFLGFGGRTVEIPEGRFTPSRQDVRLDMTADEASRLPEIKDGT
jgi:hypothetical protein